MGVGRPITETLPNIVVILQLTLSYALIYNLCITTVKLSVLFFYLRIFPNKDMRMASKIVIALISVWSLANILMFLLLCHPFAAIYNPALPGGKCGNQIGAFIAVGVYNIISDFVVLTLPLRTIWTLNTKNQMKLSLSGIFLIGLLYVIHSSPLSFFSSLTWLPWRLIVIITGCLPSPLLESSP